MNIYNFSQWIYNQRDNKTMCKIQVLVGPTGKKRSYSLGRYEKSFGIDMKTIWGQGGNKEHFWMGRKVGSQSSKASDNAGHKMV